MKEIVLTVKENERLTMDVCRMKLEGDVSAITNPGQFVNLRIAGQYLRRPISVNDLEVTDEETGEGILTLLYKVVGKGTLAMAMMQPETRVNMLAGLGNGFDLDAAGPRPFLVGGGIGCAPLYWLAKELAAREETEQIIVVLGFRSAQEIYYADEFEKLGCEVRITTEDGSAGIQGFVTNAMPTGRTIKYTYLYACGPEPMLKAVYYRTERDGEFSFEERMGCGFGACMGCSCKTITGYKRICKEGPVMKKEEILWEN